MEIERKFAIKQMPESFIGYQNKKIEQGYLCNDPIIRIRKSNEDFILTYKSKRGIDPYTMQGAIMNQEIELPLTEKAYQTLKEKTEGNMVYKTRYLIPLEDGLTAELDIFERQLSGLIFAEVEFPDPKTADEFVPPDWFGEDLSQDKRFSNYHLSKLSCYEDLNF